MTPKKLLPTPCALLGVGILTNAALQAQLVGLVFEFEAEEPEYKTVPASASFTALLIQLNAEGAAGYRRSGPRLFVTGLGSVNREVYVRDLQNPSTYQYQFDTVETAAIPFLAQLNNHGGEGFAFAGNYSVPGTPAERSIYESDASETVTYEYQLVGAGSSSTDITTLNTAGANGW